MNRMPSHIAPAKPPSHVVPAADPDRHRTDAALLALARVLAAIAASRPDARSGGSHAA
jgi:hypothetical protein